MTHDEAIAFWYSRIDYERRAPKPGDLKLDRMRHLLRLLGDPHARLRCVHVAGTKGKGSTAAILASILDEAGYRTGLFTSPHLARVEERIRVAGVPISHTELAARMAEIVPAVREMDRPGDPDQSPTFFEVGTALGFLHFDCRRVDVAVVEVGLGGRFDSTNVIFPLISVITSISFDHMEQLGYRLVSIAREKAGIIKPRCPTVSGAAAPEADEVITRIAKDNRSPLARIGHDFDYRYTPARFDSEEVPPSVEVVTARRHWPAMALNLLGDHQAANAALAIAAIESLRASGMHIADDAVRRGLAKVTWPARLEIVARRPWIVLDCAHNVASAQALVDTLTQTFAAKRRHLVFATSIDKDVPGILHVLAPHFDTFYLTSFRNNPRTVPPDRLAQLLGDIVPGAKTVILPRSEDAIAAARSAASPDDLIAVTGSVFLAGELRPSLVSGLA